VSRTNRSCHQAGKSDDNRKGLLYGLGREAVSVGAGNSPRYSRRVCDCSEGSSAGVSVNPDSERKELPLHVPYGDEFDELLQCSRQLEDASQGSVEKITEMKVAALKKKARPGVTEAI